MWSGVRRLINRPHADWKSDGCEQGDQKEAANNPGRAFTNIHLFFPATIFCMIDGSGRLRYHLAATVGQTFLSVQTLIFIGKAGMPVPQKGRMQSAREGVNL